MSPPTLKSRFGAGDIPADRFLDSCSICMLEFAAGEAVFVTDCWHFYHRACIKQAADKVPADRLTFPCPMCRAAVSVVPFRPPVPVAQLQAVAPAVEPIALELVVAPLQMVANRYVETLWLNQERHNTRPTSDEWIGSVRLIKFPEPVLWMAYWYATHGANVNVPVDGRTALYRTVQCSDRTNSHGFELMNALITAGADVNALSNKTDFRAMEGEVVIAGVTETALHAALRRWHLVFVHRLLEAGASVGTDDIISVIEMVARARHTAARLVVFQELINHVDWNNPQDNMIQHALCAAITSGCIRAADLILDRIPRTLDCEDSLVQPLHLVMRNSRAWMPVFRKILNAGAQGPYPFNPVDEHCVLWHAVVDPHADTRIYIVEHVLDLVTNVDDDALHGDFIRNMFEEALEAARSPHLWRHPGPDADLIQVLIGRAPNQVGP